MTILHVRAGIGRHTLQTQKGDTTVRYGLAGGVLLALFLLLQGTMITTSAPTPFLNTMSL